METWRLCVSGTVHSCTPNVKDTEANKTLLSYFFCQITKTENDCTNEHAQDFSENKLRILEITNACARNGFFQTN